MRVIVLLNNGFKHEFPGAEWVRGEHTYSIKKDGELVAQIENNMVAMIFKEESSGKIVAVK